jgi:hypothetical protein
MQSSGLRHMEERGNVNVEAYGKGGKVDVDGTKESSSHCARMTQHWKTISKNPLKGCRTWPEAFGVLNEASLWFGCK